MLLPPPENEGQKYQVVLHQGPSEPDVRWWKYRIKTVMSSVSHKRRKIEGGPVQTQSGVGQKYPTISAAKSSTQAGVATDLFVIDTSHQSSTETEAERSEEISPPSPPPVRQQEFLRYFGLLTHHEAEKSR